MSGPYLRELQKMTAGSHRSPPAGTQDREAVMPTGWKLVPIIPTKKMIARGYATRPTEECWRVMLEASPIPPAPTQDREAMRLILDRYWFWDDMSETDQKILLNDLAALPPAPIPERAGMREALDAIDAFVAFHRDYTTMPSDDFFAKHGLKQGHSSERFSKLRQACVETSARARAALAPPDDSAAVSRADRGGEA